MSPSNQRDASSYRLTLRPVDLSLTAGTNIPPPTDADLARPPTPGGGPLTSHPTTPEEKKQSNPFDAAPLHYQSLQNGASSRSVGRSPDQIDSINGDAPRRSLGMRRLISLSNLRGSFSSSRTSLVPASQTSERIDSHHSQSLERPWTPSTTASRAPSIIPGHQSQAPSTRRKRSSGWFRRRSSLFKTNSDSLNAVAEGPESRDGKRAREERPPAFLPEVARLKGGDLQNGTLGLSEKTFKLDP